MRLVLEPSSARRRVTPSAASDYNMFRSRFGPETPAGELLVLERFHGVQLAMNRGYGELYVDGELRGIDQAGTLHRVRLDVIGRGAPRHLAVLCEAGADLRTLGDKVELLAGAENVDAVLLFASGLAARSFLEEMPQLDEGRRLTIEQLPCVDGEPRETIGDLLQLVDILANETRMRMLIPLLGGPCGKRVYRRDINPKLVYANITRLLEEGLVCEADAGYTLTSLGSRVMGEYLVFLAKMRRLLEDSKSTYSPVDER